MGYTPILCLHETVSFHQEKQRKAFVNRSAKLSYKSKEDSSTINEKNYSRCAR